MTNHETPRAAGESYGREPLTYQSVELEASPASEFLPLGARRVLYVLGLAALVVAPSIAVELPDYGQAITTAGNLLGAAALGTALANPTR